MFGSEIYDATYYRIRYLISQKVVLDMFFLTIMQKWNGLNTFFENHLSLYDLASQADFFGFTFREYFGKHLDDSILQNHLLLVFTALLLEIKKIKCLEKKIAETNGNMHKSYLFKWNKINNQLTADK